MPPKIAQAARYNSGKIARGDQDHTSISIALLTAIRPLHVTPSFNQALHPIHICVCIGIHIHICIYICICISIRPLGATYPTKYFIPIFRKPMEWNSLEVGDSIWRWWGTWAHLKVLTYNVQLNEPILAENAHAMTIMLPPSESHSVFTEKSLSVGMRCPQCPHSEGRVTRGIVSDPEEGYWSPMTGEWAAIQWGSR